MVGYGVVVLLIMFALTLLYFYLSLSTVLAFELVNHIIITAVVWFLAGILSYLLTSWIVLEPTWKMRILATIISVLLLKIFFFNVAGEAYNAFLPILIIYTIVLSSLSYLSVIRFKEGKQD